MSPKPRVPTNPPGNNLPIKHPVNHVSFDSAAFNNLLKANGVRVKHFKAIPDPRGLSDYGSNRTDRPVGNSNGYIYKEVGCFTAVLQSNSKTPIYEVEGQLDPSSAIMTPPQYYEGEEKKPIIIDVWDRFELQDIEVRVETSELVESTTIGRDNLRFPATCVEYLIGSDGFEYQNGVHYVINPQGQIEWKGQIRPRYNTDLNKGEIYSVRYRYIPYYVARRLLHEIRVSQITDMATGERYVERLPYQVHVARENVFRDTMNTSEGIAEDPRFKDVPSNGNIFGKNRS